MVVLPVLYMSGRIIDSCVEVPLISKITPMSWYRDDADEKNRRRKRRGRNKKDKNKNKEIK